jgi:cysteine synthase A
MHEITTALHGKVDYLFCSTSTCGTIRGCTEYIRRERLKTRVFAVDAVGSVIFGGQKAPRLIPGHGSAVVPALYQPGTIDRCVHVTDLDCVIGCRRLVREEGILAGGSSGGVLMALHRVEKEIPDDSNCVLIFPDRGERYLETIYSDAWVEKNFGEVSHHWSEVELGKCPVTAS